MSNEHKNHEILNFNETYVPKIAEIFLFSQQILNKRNDSKKVKQKATKFCYLHISLA